MGYLKAVLREKFTALSAYIRNLEKPHSSYLTAHLKALKQRDANAPRKSKCQEIIRLRAESNKIETKKTMQKINERKSRFFEKISKIDMSSPKLTKRHRGNMQIYKFRNEKGGHSNQQRKSRESSGHTSKTCAPQK